MRAFTTIILCLLCPFFLFSCSTGTYQEKNLELAHINMQLGLLYLQEGEVVVAKSKLLLAYEKAPRDPMVHDALGYFFSHTGEVENAARHYLCAIKIANKKGLFWHHYGEFLFQQGSYQQALGYFLHAAKDLSYLNTGKAYADASKASFKLQKFELAEGYQAAAVAHGYPPEFASNKFK